jgi:hypothetical protein
MQELVCKATRTNGYDQLALQSNSVTAFRSPRFKDIILVANYGSSELNDFDDCSITVDVMSAYDEVCKVHPDALKSTSLIICHKVADINERDTVKNTVLKIEENSFGLRKFIVSYTDSSIVELLKIDEAELVGQLHTKIQSGFGDFIDSRAQETIEEYDIVLQLFIKLPFMKIQSNRATTELTPLTEFLIDKLTKYSPILDLIRNQSVDENVYDIFQQDINLDLEINALLQDSKVDIILNPEKEQK